MIKRCGWVSENDPLMKEYHDKEWGVPLRNDNKIFEFLCLESFQAGLSWRTILNKRKNFEKAFAGFNPVKVSKFGRKDLKRLMSDRGIVRNRMKIEAAINNASKFLEVKKEFGTFSKYMWGFVGNPRVRRAEQQPGESVSGAVVVRPSSYDGNRPIINKIRRVSDYKPVSDQAIIWAKDLKKRGFKFLGPTTLYAHMQATGMVDDHMSDCFRKNNK